MVGLYYAPVFEWLEIKLDIRTVPRAVVHYYWWIGNGLVNKCV